MTTLAKLPDDFAIWSAFMFGLIDDALDPPRPLPKPTIAQVANYLAVPESRVKRLSLSMRKDDMSWTQERDRLRKDTQNSIADRVSQGIAVGVADEKLAIRNFLNRMVEMAQMTIDKPGAFVSAADGTAASKALRAIHQDEEGRKSGGGDHYEEMIIRISRRVEEPEDWSKFEEADYEVVKG